MRQITQEAKGVKVQLDKGHVSATAGDRRDAAGADRADRYEPLLPVLRDQLTQRAPMGSYAKVDVVYDEPFWREEGLTGQTVSLNGPVRVTFDSTPGGGSPGVLLGFIGGSDARSWYGLSPNSAARR